MKTSLSIISLALGVFLGGGSSAAEVSKLSFPPGFRDVTIDRPDGARFSAKVGGDGPVVVLLHGYTHTSDAWAPVVADLHRDHRVVAPDLRGAGRSWTPPSGGYDKKTQAQDVRALLESLNIDRVRAVVGHDIGLMVAYAYAAQHRDKLDRLVVMEAPLPGVAPWEEILKDPRAWHFNFRGPHAERLVAGRERIYFDRFWDEFAVDPTKITAPEREFFTALYARPGGMAAGWAQFAAFPKDAEDNKQLFATKLTTPVLAVGGEKSFGPLVATIARNVATDVREAVVTGAGHWLVEEQPEATIKAIRDFIKPAP